MSQENVEVVRRVYESQGRPEFLQLLDPHVVWINYMSALRAEPYLGHEGVLDWAKDFRDNFGDFRMEAKELIDAGGDQVVVVSRFIGTGIKSGVPLEQEFGSLFTLLNGKVVRCQGFESVSEALEAAGLRE
jgi:ketosteroid isomerase-like protein